MRSEAMAGDCAVPSSWLHLVAVILRGAKRSRGTHPWDQAARIGAQALQLAWALRLRAG